MTIRIVARIDLDTDDPTKAYTMLDKALGLAESTYSLEWESSDEWYGPDGEPMDEEEISRVRMEFHDGAN